MVENILHKIILKKEKRLFELKKTISIDFLNEKIQEDTNLLNFKDPITLVRSPIFEKLLLFI